MYSSVDICVNNCEIATKRQQPIHGPGVQSETYWRLSGGAGGLSGILEEKCFLLSQTNLNMENVNVSIGTGPTLSGEV